MRHSFIYYIIWHLVHMKFLSGWWWDFEHQWIVPHRINTWRGGKHFEVSQKSSSESKKWVYFGHWKPYRILYIKMCTWFFKTTCTACPWTSFIISPQLDAIGGNDSLLLVMVFHKWWGLATITLISSLPWSQLFIRVYFDIK